MRIHDQMLGNLGRMARFFVGFLGVLSALLSTHYPILPDRLIATYGEDANSAKMLATALTLIGFAVITAIVSTPRAKLFHITHHMISTRGLLEWSGGALLTMCALGLAAGYVFVHVSTRIGNAVLAAEARAPVDYLARDFAAEAHDPSMSTWQRYRSSTEYIDLEQVMERSPQEVLTSVGHGPLQGPLVAVYIVTIIGFKVGLWCIASVLYLRSRTSQKVKGHEVFLKTSTNVH